MSKFQIVQMVDEQLVSTILDGTAEGRCPVEAFEVRGFKLTGRQGGAHLRVELRGQPIFAGLAGPMWGGVVDGQPCVRYEDAAACDLLSR